MISFKELYEQEYEFEPEIQTMTRFDQLDQLMVDFLDSFDPDDLSEEQYNMAYRMLEIIEWLCSDSDQDFDIRYDEEVTTSTDVGDYKPPLMKKKKELDEVQAKRTKRDRMSRIERRKYYKKNKAKIKRTQKKFRASSAGKKYLKKKKKMSTRGKTASGQRIKTYTN